MISKNEHDVKTALFQQDLMATMQNWDAWRMLIGEFVQNDPDGQAGSDFERTYRALAADDDTDAMYNQLCADQLDNYIMGSFAAYRMGIPKETPMVAWAAENKRRFEGFHGEIANLRTLLIMGFDPDIPDQIGGNTAMHKMCGMKWGEGVHVRAIEALLESGASPNTANGNGDTPFTYLCGSHPFTDRVKAALMMMLAAGAEPSIKAADGADALDVLKLTEKVQPDPARVTLINKIESGRAVGEFPKTKKPGRKAPL